MHHYAALSPSLLTAFPHIFSFPSTYYATAKDTAAYADRAFIS